GGMDGRREEEVVDVEDDPGHVPTVAGDGEGGRVVVLTPLEAAGIRVVLIGDPPNVVGVGVDHVDVRRPLVVVCGHQGCVGEDGEVAAIGGHVHRDGIARRLVGG